MAAPAAQPTEVAQAVVLLVVVTVVELSRPVVLVEVVVERVTSVEVVAQAHQAALVPVVEVVAQAMAQASRLTRGAVRHRAIQPMPTAPVLVRVVTQEQLVVPVLAVVTVSS